MMYRIAARATLRTQAALAAILLPALLIGLSAQQADRTQTDGLAARAAERLRTLHAEADRLAAEERSLIGDVRKLELDRQIRNEEFSQLAGRADTAARQLAATNEQVARLEREDLAERPEMAERLVTLYKLGQGRYLRMLLSVSDVRSLGQATRMVTSLAERDRERITTHQKRLEELKSTRATLQAQSKTLAAEKVKADQARGAADRALAARNALIANIDAARDLNAQLAGELQVAQQKLQAALRTAGSTSGAAEAALPIRPFRGELDWPVAGTVRQQFGRAAAGRPPSNGIEVTAAEGAPVTAIHGGTVAFADTFAGFGKLVIVDHGMQVFSLYGNLLEIAVTSGAHLDASAPIGTVGPSATQATPEGTGSLYFELRVDDRPVDPLQWLKRK